MPHNHFCRYCGDKFICPENADECFQKFIVCQECFWNHDFKHFLLVFALAVVALLATVFLFRQHKEKPAMGSPVTTIKKTTTGENYYENERKTN